VLNKVLLALHSYLTTYLELEPPQKPAKLKEWWEDNLPTSTEEIEGGLVYALLQERFPDAELFISDRRYNLANYNDIALFIAQDETNKMGYVPDKRDCDDFSYRLMGQFSVPGWSALTFGIIWTPTHAFNIMITEDLEIWFVEPQTDVLTKEPESDVEPPRMIIM